MRARVFAAVTHPICLAAWALLILALSFFTGLEHAWDAVRLLGEAKSSFELVIEEQVAVILVAFGVLLEERRVLAGGFGAIPPLEDDRALDRICEVYGVYVLMLGLVMETVDIGFEPLMRATGWGGLGVALMGILHMLAVALLGFFVVRVLIAWRRPPREPGPSAHAEVPGRD